MIKNLKNKSPKVDESCFIAESADIIGDVTVGKNSSVWYNCVLRADGNKIVIGENTNVQDGTVMHIENNYPLFITVNATSSLIGYLEVGELSSDIKCKKCKSRDATGEDGLCNNCRFVLILDSMAEKKAIECAREQTKRRYTQ